MQKVLKPLEVYFGMVYNINWWKKELYPLFNNNNSEPPGFERKKSRVTGMLFYRMGAI